MRIGLTLGHDASKNEKSDYIRALMDAGFRREEIVVLAPGSEPEGRFDGVVLGGGLDVDPARYGREIKPDANVEIDPERDSTDFAAFEKARQEEVPVLGICRGMQLVNVALGGTLHQDIPSERPSRIVHEVPGQHPERRDHKVEVKPGTRLSEIARAAEIDVNSRHHQAVERLAPGIEVSAVAPDGLIEAFESASPWLLAVQWHPENLLADPASTRIFAEFARAVRARAAEGIPGGSSLLTRESVRKKERERSSR
jgi:putative glutamine amidotransferase